jgi:hypothetical protein
MHEAEKLREAEYFYSQVADPGQVHGFIYNLRALLNSARTVIVYMHKETKGKGDSQQWYQNAVEHPVIEFLSKVRHVDNHDWPVGTNQTVFPMPAVMTIGSPPYMTQSVRPALATRHEFADEGPARATRHNFAKWPGPEDVRELCRAHLDAIAAMVSDGQAKGFLTS